MNIAELIAELQKHDPATKVAFTYESQVLEVYDVSCEDEQDWVERETPQLMPTGNKIIILS